MAPVLPIDIWVIVVEHLLVNASFKGCYTTPALLVSGRDPHHSRKQFHDLMQVGQTCRKLHSLVSSIVWNYLEANSSSLFFRQSIVSHSRLVPCTSLLQYVTWYEPVSYLQPHADNAWLDHHDSVLSVITPKRMPALQRVTIDFYGFAYQDEDILYALLSQLVLYDEYGSRIRISTIISSTRNIGFLPGELLTYVDRIEFFYSPVVTPGWRNLLMEHKLRQLISIRVNIAPTTEVNEDDAQSLERVVLNNCSTIRHLIMPRHPYFIDRLPSLVPELERVWSLPHLETLNCVGITSLSPFLQSLEVCENLKKLEFTEFYINGQRNPELAFPHQMSCLTHFVVPRLHGTIKRKIRFLENLLLACPKLETLEFSHISAADLIELGPLIHGSKVKFVKVAYINIYDLPTRWPFCMNRESIQDEAPSMPINLIIEEFFPSNIKRIHLPMDAHELLSYPILKALALRDSTNDDAFAPILHLAASWPRVSDQLTREQLRVRSEFFTKYPHSIILSSSYSRPTIYPPITRLPVGNAGTQHYLSQLFFGFDEPFPVTKFTFFLRKRDDIDDAQTRMTPWHSCEVIVDLQILRKLLLSQAG